MITYAAAKAVSYFRRIAMYSTLFFFGTLAYRIDNILNKLCSIFQPHLPSLICTPKLYSFLPIHTLEDLV